MTSRMFGGRCRLSSVILFSLALFIPALASAQDPAPAFQDLQSILSVGDTIRVNETNGKTAEGTLVSVSAAALTLKVKGSSREFHQPQIREVKVKYTDSIWNGVRNGVLIGVASGAVLGAVAYGPECKGCGGERGLGAVAVGLGGAMYGAGAGLIVDFFKKSYTTAYKAPKIAEKGFDVSPILSRKAKGGLSRISILNQQYDYIQGLIG